MSNINIEAVSVILNIILILIISFMILLYYMETSVELSYSSVIFASFFLGFIGIAIFPIDIGLSNEGESASIAMVILWYFIYIVTLILSWLYLPIMIEYWASGEFSRISRLKEAARSYVSSYAPLGVIGILLVIYVLVSKTATFSTFISVVMALVNTYGLCFIVIYLGYGLVSVPIYLFKKLYYTKELNELYMQAHELDQDKFDYEMQVVSVKLNIRELRRAFQQASLSPELLNICDSMLSSFPEDDEINLARHQRGHVDKSQWIEYSVDALKSLSEKTVKKSLSKLNSRSKHVCLVYQRKINQYEELLDSIATIRHVSGSSEIPLETSHGTNESIYYWVKRLFYSFYKPITTIAFFITVFLSCLIGFTELTTFFYALTNKAWSPLSWVYSMKGNTSLRVAFGAITLIYLSVCFFYGFFNFRIPFFGTYHLYPHYTDVYSLGYNACYLCRYQFSLFYHYFTLFQLPESAYNEVALSVVMGPIRTIFFLGLEFNNYMPILVIAVAAFTLWREMQHRKKQMMIHRQLSASMDEVHADVKRIQEGKQIVEISLRKRGMSREDIEVQAPKKKRYYYREIKYVQ